MAVVLGVHNGVNTYIVDDLIRIERRDSWPRFLPDPTILGDDDHVILSRVGTP